MQFDNSTYMSTIDYHISCRKVDMPLNIETEENHITGAYMHIWIYRYITLQTGVKNSFHQFLNSILFIEME